MSKLRFHIVTEKRGNLWMAFPTEEDGQWNGHPVGEGKTEPRAVLDLFTQCVRAVEEQPTK